LGAAYLAGLAIGTWRDEHEVAGAWAPRAVIEPSLTDTQRDEQRHRWLQARQRAEGTIPELSALDF
jgi:glycerol kinase